MLSTPPSRPLVLASRSTIRRAMLTNAGVAHEVQAADVDEDAVKREHADPAAAAQRLAEAKALAISRERPEEWIIGSDSIVTVGAQQFDKPRNRAEAAQHLGLFSGQTMILTSAVAIARRGKVEWSVADHAELRVRDLTDDFIADYLEAEWPEVGQCVGVFRLEGRGVQLFDSIQGDHFTVLGMPLLPLLGALRAREIIAS